MRQYDFPCGPLGPVGSMLYSEDRWTQHTMHRNATGRVCDKHDRYSSCVMGAIELVYPRFSKEESRAYNKVRDYVTGLDVRTVTLWNDTRSYSEVYSMLVETGI